MRYLEKPFCEEEIPLQEEDCLLGHKGALSPWLAAQVCCENVIKGLPVKGRSPFPECKEERRAREAIQRKPVKATSQEKQLCRRALKGCTCCDRGCIRAREAKACKMRDDAGLDMKGLLLLFSSLYIQK